MALPGPLGKDNKMTKMKDYADEMMADINQTQEPVHEIPEEVKERIYSRVCYFCGFGEIMMWRDRIKDRIVEHFHCPNCERSYFVLANLKPDEFKVFETEESWLDLWCRNNQ